MYLKLGDPSDLVVVKSMALKFFNASPYRHFQIDPTKVEQTCLDVLTGDKMSKIVIILMTDDRTPVGMIAGVSQEALFSTEKWTAELMWWVDPDYRSRDSLRLVEALEFWSKKVGSRYQQLSALEDALLPKVSAYYKRRKYKVTEHVYMKELI